MSSENPSIYTMQFGLLCLSSLLFSASFNMMIPELPNYLTSIGGAEHKGLIIALFTLTACIARPFSGKLTDTWGRVPVMAIGSAVCVICSLLYPILTSLSGFFLLRLVHGFSTGFKPTATSAYISDIIPKGRWGEALGMHGLSFSIGGALGPTIGSYLVAWYDINTMFYCSSALALLSIVIVMNMKETLVNKHSFNISMLRISKSDIIDAKVIPAGIVTMLSYTGYGVILTLIPDWSEYLGISNKGLFFAVFTIASVGIRFISGKASDKYGRIIVMLVGVLITSASLMVIAWSNGINELLLGSCIYGVGTGILSPAVNAWTIDLSSIEHRGKAVATMYIALEIGIGGGALFSGYIYHDVINRIPMIIFGTGIVILLGFFYIIYWDYQNKKSVPIVSKW